MYRNIKVYAPEAQNNRNKNGFCFLHLYRHNILKWLIYPLYIPMVTFRFSIKEQVLENKIFRIIFFFQNKFLNKFFKTYEQQSFYNIRYFLKPEILWIVKSQSFPN